MKTLEDLEQMTIAQLEGIAVGLGANVPSKVKKADLVQLVYDIQQPTEDEQTEADDTPAEEPKRDVKTVEEVDTKKAAIEKHFGGELIEDGEQDGIVMFAVIDEDAETLAQGTFLALHKQAIGEEEPADAGTLGDVPLDTEPQPEEPDALPVELIATEGLDEIKKALNVLRAYGLKYEIDGGIVRLTKESRTITTTLNQPAHRVVRTAETLCNYK